jgi:hypothetical protein
MLGGRLIIQIFFFFFLSRGDGGGGGAARKANKNGVCSCLPKQPVTIPTNHTGLPTLRNGIHEKHGGCMLQTDLVVQKLRCTRVQLGFRF